MRSIAALALALIVAGCSGDPATSRLSEGSEAMVRAPELDPKRPAIPGYIDGAGEFVPNDVVEPNTVEMKPQGSTTFAILAGAKVRVIEDHQDPAIKGPAKPYLADLDGEADRRWVKVQVLDGRSTDRVGELPRNALRPLP